MFELILAIITGFAAGYGLGIDQGKKIQLKNMEDVKTRLFFLDRRTVRDKVNGEK